MSLRIKLLLLFIILALIPLSVAGRSMIRITRDELKSAANDNLIMIASQVTQIIDDFYRYSWLNPLLLIQKIVENENLGVNEKLSLLTEGMKNAPDIVALQISVVGVASPLLVIQDGFSGRLKERSLDAANILRLTPNGIAALLEEDDIFVGDLTFLSEGDIWLITIILPLDESTFDRPATLSARINLDRLRTRIENHPFNKKGFITLIDLEGRKIFDHDRPDLTPRALVKTAKKLLASNVCTIGAEPYVRPSGEKMLGAYSCPRKMDFGVIVEKYEADAYLAVTQMERNLIIWIWGNRCFSVSNETTTEVDAGCPYNFGR